MTLPRLPGNVTQGAMGIFEGKFKVEDALRMEKPRRSFSSQAHIHSQGHARQSHAPPEAQYVARSRHSRRPPPSEAMARHGEVRSGSPELYAQEKYTKKMAALAHAKNEVKMSENMSLLEMRSLTSPNS